MLFACKCKVETNNDNEYNPKQTEGPFDIEESVKRFNVDEIQVVCAIINCLIK